MLHGETLRVVSRRKPGVEIPVADRLKWNPTCLVSPCGSPGFSILSLSEGEAMTERTAIEISDGLDTLRAVIGLREIMSLIERTARWVSPDTFKLLPLWFPEHARRAFFYKNNWSEPQMNKS